MRTIDLMKAQEQLTTLIEEEIDQSGDGIEIISEGERLAVLLRPAEYDRLRRVTDGALKQAWDAIEEIRAFHADKSEEELAELERLIHETVEEVRQEMYEERLASRQ